MAFEAHRNSNQAKSGKTPEDSVEEMWAAFLAARPGLAPPGAACSAWHFCDNQADADELADLVLAGRKRGTASVLWSYETEDEPLPRVGDLSVITSWSGEARCVIRTSLVEVLAFADVGEDFAAAEGEGDGSLAYWREAHWAAFGRELEGFDRSPAPDMPVVCERFEVVFPLVDGPASPGRRRLTARPPGSRSSPEEWRRSR